MADDSHPTSAPNNIWTGGAPNSLRLTRAEKSRLNDVHSENTDFAFLNDDSAFREMLDALARLGRDIEHAGAAAGRVRLVLDYQEKSPEQEPAEAAVEEPVSEEPGITVRSESSNDGSGSGSGWHHTASWPHQHRAFDTPLYFQADVRHDGSGNVDIQLAVNSYSYKITYQSYSRECEGPVAVIRELSAVVARHCGDLKYIHPHNAKNLLFLRTLCSVVARSFREPDPGREAENRWAAAATGAWEAVDTATEISLCEAMREAWETSGLSTDCPCCQVDPSEGASGEGARRLMKVATGELVDAERGGRGRAYEYAAVSYCWGSVTSDEDLLRQVHAAVAGTPIEYVWVDRFCLSAEPAPRQEEVHRMGDVYARARLVVVLPGAAVPELDHLRYDANGTAVRVTPENSRRVGDQWTQAEWRSRCWTFQEASMARATAVVTGSRKRPVLSGAALDALATASTEGTGHEGGSVSVKLAPWHPLDDTWLRADAHTYEASRDGKHHLFHRSHRACGACGRPRGGARPPKQPLLVLMGLSWHRRASREQDTVYALLSMAEGGDRVPVRYDVPLEAVYRVLIRTRVVGAEVMALGGGYVGGGAAASSSSSSWVPRRNGDGRGVEAEAEARVPVNRRGEWLRNGEAGITDRDTLRAAVVPVSIAKGRDGGTVLWLAGLEKQHYVRDGLGPGEDLPGLVEMGWQAHALAPLTALDWPGWRLVLVFSSPVEGEGQGEGGVRRVERTLVLSTYMPSKRGMESLAIETIEYAS